MKVERWDGMYEGDVEPGCVVWHLTVIRNGSKVGVLFNAPPDTAESELISAGLAKYKERYPEKE